MKKTIKDKWLKELRSGTYKKLDHSFTYLRFENKYTPMGVLVQIFVDSGLISEYEGFYITSPPDQETGRIVAHKTYLCQEVSSLCNIPPGAFYKGKDGKSYSLHKLHWAGLSLEEQANFIEKTIPEE